MREVIDAHRGLEFVSAHSTRGASGREIHVIVGGPSPVDKSLLAELVPLAQQHFGDDAIVTLYWQQVLSSRNSAD